MRCTIVTRLPPAAAMRPPASTQGLAPSPTTKAGTRVRIRRSVRSAIPTAAAGKSTRGGRITPGEWERRTGLRLRFVYRRTGPSLLVAEGRLNTRGRAVASRSKTGRGLVTAPIFLLVPQVKLPKRLDLARDAARAHDAVPGLIVANWVEAKV